jgi:hypothetical protein
MCEQRHVVSASDEFADEEIDDALDSAVMSRRHGNDRIDGDRDA